jgi:hypothetical protein
MKGPTMTYTKKEHEAWADSLPDMVIKQDRNLEKNLRDEGYAVACLPRKKDGAVTTFAMVLIDFVHCLNAGMLRKSIIKSLSQIRTHAIVIGNPENLKAKYPTAYEEFLKAAEGLEIEWAADFSEMYLKHQDIQNMLLTEGK